MCYISVSSCCPAFLHRGLSFCSGIVTSVGSPAVIWMVTCYDSVRVCLGLGRHFGSGSGSGFWIVSFVVDFGTGIEIGCVNQKTTATWPAASGQQTDFETTSTADAWAQVSPCHSRASACE